MQYAGSKLEMLAGAPCSRSRSVNPYAAGSTTMEKWSATCVGLQKSRESAQRGWWRDTTNDAPANAEILESVDTGAGEARRGAERRQLGLDDIVHDLANKES